MTSGDTVTVAVWPVVQLWEGVLEVRWIAELQGLPVSSQGATRDEALQIVGARLRSAKVVAARMGVDPWARFDLIPSAPEGAELVEVVLP